MRALLATTMFLAAATAARAADVVTDLPAEPAAIVAPYSFAGAYVGVQGGYATGFIHPDAVIDGAVAIPGVPTEYDVDGYVLGAHAGYNVEFGRFVGGIYADIDYVSLDLDITESFGATEFEYKLGDDKGFIARGLLKGGVAFDRTLVYAQGGIAYLNVDLENVDPVFGPPALVGADISFDGLGYAVGAGADYAVTDRILVGADYLYQAFDNFDAHVDGTSVDTRADLNLHTIRGKVSFRF